jgi:hypothetical protein
MKNRHHLSVALDEAISTIDPLHDPSQGGRLDTTARALQGPAEMFGRASIGCRNYKIKLRKVALFSATKYDHQSTIFYHAFTTK